MLEFLTAAVLVILLVLGVLVTTAWLALRRIRRSRLVAAGTQLVAEAILALAACRPRPTLNRAAAVPAIRISRAHRLLRQRVAAAQRSGAELGDVPALLPRLEADGRRIRAGLGRLVGSTTEDHALYAQADRHLRTLAELTDAVGAAMSAPAADESLTRDAEEAALGLRLHTAAYAELMAMGTAPSRVTAQLRPRANAS